MAYDRFLVAPLNSGLQTDLKSWQILEDSFETLNNAYLFRGRLRKRYGSSLMGASHLLSRLRISLGNTDGFGDLAGNVPGSVFKVGQQFSVGSAIYTVVNPAAGVQNMICNDITTAGTYNIANGAFDISSATPATPVWFYPLEPVMGITQYETAALNNNPTYAFDTQFAYVFAGGFWQRSSTVLWHKIGTSNFFWAANWVGLTANTTIMFASNYQAAVGASAGATDDPIKYYDGVAGTWTDFKPEFNSAKDIILTARIVLPFKDHLVLLSTIEQNAAGTTNTQYKNRCRFSHNGSPLTPAAGPAVTYGHPWLEPNQTYVSGATTYKGDGGGYVDAPTQEEIISAGFVKDRLIVYFERSTWELAYTGNYVLPFVWQKLNTELGSMSTFSSVPFDKILLTVGQTGIHVCNGGNVERIDSKIPDQIFEIRNINDGVYRVAGIRDFFTELIYWSYPVANADPTSVTFPNKVLVYNYRTGSWAINDDTITAFGYFEQSSAPTWASSTMTWAEALFAWNSGVTQARFRRILAGNQQGFVYWLDPNLSVNAPSLTITNIAATANPLELTLTVIDHTLEQDEYVKVENTNTNLDGNIFYVSTAAMTASTVTLNLPTGFVYGGGYLGGGTIRRVSYIDILTKRFNPYAKDGKNVYVAKLDFAVGKTTSGQITVDYYPSSTQISMITDGTASGSIWGNNILETSPYALVPLEAVSDMLWHPLYLQTDGQFIQLNLYLSDTQMRTPAIVESGLEIEGFVLYTTQISRLQ